MIKIEGSGIGFIDVMDLDIKQDLKKNQNNTLKRIFQKQEYNNGWARDPVNGRNPEGVFLRCWRKIVQGIQTVAKR